MQTPCLIGVCMKALVGGSWGVLYQDLVRCAPAADGPFMTICGSWHEDLAQGLLQFPARRSCGDPGAMPSEAFAWSCTGPCERLLKRSWGEILSVSWHDLIQVLVRRSFGNPVETCWNPPQEVLASRSWRSSALVLVRSSCGMLMGSSCMKILKILCLVDLCRRSCCCSSHNVFHSYCCLCLAHWLLPPTLFGVSCKRNLFLILAVRFLSSGWNPAKTYDKTCRRTQKTPITYYKNIKTCQKTHQKITQNRRLVKKPTNKSPCDPARGWGSRFLGTVHWFTRQFAIHFFLRQSTFWTGSCGGQFLCFPVVSTLRSDRSDRSDNHQIEVKW